MRWNGIPGGRILVAASCLTMVGLALGTPATALAAAPVATATGSAGEVDATVDGVQVASLAIAPCVAGGTERNSSIGEFVGVVARYGMTETHCARSADGTATAEVTGQRFQTGVLRRYGGPEITARTFSARCSTTADGSTGYVELGAVTGIRVPANIPANYRITVPGQVAGDPPMATVVLNELIAPTPADGSLTTHTMRISLFPEGGPASGDIVVGAASCDPYGR